jgi:hypothetical protein
MLKCRRTRTCGRLVVSRRRHGRTRYATGAERCHRALHVRPREIAGQIYRALLRVRRVDDCRARGLASSAGACRLIESARRQYTAGQGDEFDRHVRVGDRTAPLAAG